MREEVDLPSLRGWVSGSLYFFKFQKKKKYIYILNHIGGGVHFDIKVLYGHGGPGHFGHRDPTTQRPRPKKIFFLFLFMSLVMKKPPCEKKFMLPWGPGHFGHRDPTTQRPRHKKNIFLFLNIFVVFLSIFHFHLILS